MDSQHSKQSLTSSHQEGKMEINPLEILYFLWDHLWQIGLFALLGAIVCFGYDYFNFSPQYTAAAKVYVTPVSSDPMYNESTLSSGGTLISDCKELLLTRPVLEQAIVALGLEMDAQELAGMVEIMAPSGSRLLFIKVTGGDPVQVADIANQLAFLAETEIPSITNTQAPQVVEPALVPEIQSRPASVQKGIMGAAQGGILWCTVLLIWYFWKEYGYLLKRPQN